jgi:hypothetical protein
VLVRAVVAFDVLPYGEAEALVELRRRFVGGIDRQENRRVGAFECGTHERTSYAAAATFGMNHDLVQKPFAGGRGKHHRRTDDVGGIVGEFLAAAGDEHDGILAPNPPHMLAVGDERLAGVTPRDSIEGGDGEEVGRLCGKNFEWHGAYYPQPRPFSLRQLRFLSATGLPETFTRVRYDVDAKTSLFARLFNFHFGHCEFDALFALGSVFVVEPDGLCLCQINAVDDARGLRRDASRLPR